MANLRERKKATAKQTIVYGAPKTGKTFLAGKLAEHFKLIWVDMENGHETLLQLPEEWQDRIELIYLPDTRSYPVAIETVLKMVKATSEVAICEEHGKVSCMVCKRNDAPVSLFNPANLGTETIVVWDSLTQLSNSAIANITKSQPDDYKLDYDDWGNLGKLLDIFLSHIQQARYHNVVISHEVESETEGKKKTLVPVGGTRNFSRNVAKYFGEVVYAERKNKKHVFTSSSTAATNILTGSRTSVSLETSEDASLLSIYKPEAVGLPAESNTSTTGTKGGDKAMSALARLQANKK